MKNTKRFLSAMLALVMVLSLCPVIPFAEEASADSAYQKDAVLSADGTYTGVPAGATNITYLSDDGADANTKPDLLLSYYTYNETKRAYTIAGGYVAVAAPFEPAWNTSLGGTFYTKGNSNAIAMVQKNGTSTGSGYGTDDTLGRYRTKNGANWYSASLYLGYNTSTSLATQFNKGIGVQPGAEQGAYLLFNVSNFDSFYSVVGLTGAAANNQASNVPSGVTFIDNKGNTSTGTGAATTPGADQVIFKVYGAKNVTGNADDASFVLLSQSAGVAGQQTYEFNVDISEYRTLKLVAEGVDGKYKGSECAWGNACVYNAAPETIKLTAMNGSQQTTGLKGMPADAQFIQYLSDLHDQTTPSTLNNYVVAQRNNNNKIVLNKSYSSPSYYWVEGNRMTNGAKGTYYTEDSNGMRDHTLSGRPELVVHKDSIVLGQKGIYFEKGLGVHPDAVGGTGNYIVYDVSQLNADYFYAMVSTTGSQISNISNKNKYKVTFEVWASSDETYDANTKFAKLAYVDDITSYFAAEFNVKIEGYKYIKLLVRMSDTATANDGCAVAWGGACVYSLPEVEVEDPFQSEPRPTTPLDPSYYAGKKVSILGDSISTYSNVSHNAAYNSTIGVNKGYYGDTSFGGFTRKDTWWQQTIDLMGMELLVDNAWGGACILNDRSNEFADVGPDSIAYLDRCVNLHNDKTGEKPDVIFVFKGTNDFSYFPSTLGSAEDIDYPNLIIANDDGTYYYATPSTTAEAYAIMLHKMKVAYPEAEIFCMTLMPRRGEQAQPTEFNATIKAIAERFGCGVVELGNLFSSDPAEFDLYIADQKVHPNKAGMDLMTQALVNTMLNQETPVFNVTYEYKNGVLDNNAHVAFGSDFQITLTPAVVNRGVKDVTVTMGGVDITSQVYSNGTINIPSVTGDVVISATSNPLIGKAENATNVQYLSGLFGTNVVDQLNGRVNLDTEYSSDLYVFIEGKRYVIKNHNNTDANGNRTFTLSDGTEVTFHYTDIALGVNGIKFEKGLGVHPDAIGKEDRYITYDVSGLNVDRFYAVVGATGAELTDFNANVRRVEFEVWGSVDGTNFTQIARANKIRAYVMAEFDLDITGYNFIKLVVKMDPTSDANTSCAVAWGDACFYTIGEPEHVHTPTTAVVENKVDATCGKAGSYDSVVYCSECHEEISRTTEEITASGIHSWNEGVITQAPTAEADGVRTFTCSVCNQTKTEAVKYLDVTFGQTSQVYLIEPWALTANVRIRHSGNVKFEEAEMNALDGWGVYFIRESDLNREDDATQTNTTIDEIISNPNVVHKVKGADIKVNATGSEPNMLSCDFNEGIYTYELSDSVFVLYYVVYDGYTYYAPLRERNLSQLVNSGITETQGTYSAEEKAVFTVMAELERDIVSYRDGRDINTLEMNAPTLGEYGLTGNIKDVSKLGAGKSFGHTMNIMLIEPWGLTFNGKINLEGVDYDELGMVIYYDSEGKFKDGGMTVEALMTYEDAYVFSTTNGEATTSMDGARTVITATYNSGLYTYQMEEKAYVVFYVKCGDDIFCGPMKERTIKEAINSRLGVSGVAGTIEAECLNDMLDLYDQILVLRKKVFG